MGDKSVLTFDSMYRTLKKAVEQYFTVVMFVFQLSPVCNFGKLINFGLGTVRSERANTGSIWLFVSCNSQLTGACRFDLCEAIAFESNRNATKLYCLN